MADHHRQEKDQSFESVDELLESLFGSTKREYNEAEELMRYVWRNYPEIVRPHECVGSAEQVCEKLPLEFRNEYWQHAIECRRIVRESEERDRKASNEEESITSMPILPSLRPELLELSMPIRQELEQQLFWEKFQPHQQHVSINRCPACNKIVINDKTRQCLWCGHDWH